MDADKVLEEHREMKSAIRQHCRECVWKSSPKRFFSNYSALVNNCKDHDCKFWKVRNVQD